MALQDVVSSARTLADISDERVVPVDYLVALIALFLLMVLDRLVYSRGNCFGKARGPLMPFTSYCCCTKRQSYA